MKHKKDKLYVVQKYVKAQSAAEAIRKEKKVPVHDVYVDNKWREANQDRLADAVGIGFHANGKEIDDE